MNDKTFGSPVFVKDGSFVIQEILSVGDALDFLDESQRALHAAHDGRYPVSAAREAFASWARSAKILEDVSTTPPWMTAPKAGRGGVPA
jgi:hypothetical protein